MSLSVYLLLLDDFGHVNRASIFSKRLTLSLVKGSGEPGWMKETHYFHISQLFHQAEEGGRNEVLLRLFTSEINTQRKLQDGGDRRRESSEARMRSWRSLRSCPAAERTAGSLPITQEPGHRMEMRRVNINKRFPPWNMTGSLLHLLFVDNLRQHQTEIRPAASFRRQDDVSL